MASITGLTRNGQVWTPKFATSIDIDTCIGCGRCFKACSKGVFELTTIEVEEHYLEKDIMTIKHPGRCIGCGACGRTCPKNCFTLEEVEL